MNASNHPAPKAGCSLVDSQPGADPLDHRCPSADRAQPRPAEETVRRLLAPHLDGTLIAYDTRRGHLDWDFCLVDPRGNHDATVEATQGIDRPRHEFKIRLERAGGAIWDAPGVGRSWLLTLHDDIDPRTVDRPALFDLCRRANQDPKNAARISTSAWRTELAALGVRYMLRRSSRDTDRIYITPASQSWWAGDDHVTDLLSREAGANESKLRAAPAPRHLVVAMHDSSIPAFFEITRAAPQLDPVQLPQWVDVAWAAYEDLILWRVTSGAQWQIIKDRFGPQDLRV